MWDIKQARKGVVTRVLQGNGMASLEQRRAAFDNAGFTEPLGTLIKKVALQAYAVTDGDISAVQASGLSQDQVFELVVCAAIGQASRQLDSALAALEAATQKE